MSDGVSIDETELRRRRGAKWTKQHVKITYLVDTMSNNIISDLVCLHTELVARHLDTKVLTTVDVKIGCLVISTEK